MKRNFVSFMLACALCSNAFAGEKIIVGATPVPHAEILEAIKGELAKKGFDLEIKEFNDYVVPNVATAEGELDANFYQHKPYLDEFNKNKNTNLVATVAVHLEPMGVYSKKIKSLKELKNGAKVTIPNDPTNESRALDVLAAAGLIELGDGALKTPLDITKNPLNLEFVELEGASLPRVLDDCDISVINTNFAFNAGLNPTKDALAIESKDSPYANIVVVRSGDENSKKTKALDEALTSQTVREFIEKKYGGAIIPAF
jgi:D-methionine-binding lipoprotein metQ